MVLNAVGSCEKSSRGPDPLCFCSTVSGGSGMAFLIHGVTTEPLDARFANSAAYGDLLASLLLAIAGLRGNWTIATTLVWVFNLLGSLDLMNALAQGVQFVPNGHFGAMYFIPAIIVPALLVSHGVIFLLLIGRPSPERD